MIHRVTQDRYVIRILTKPYQGMEHPIGKGFVGCGNYNIYQVNCPICLAGHGRQRYWLFGVLNRLDKNRYDIFKFNLQLCEGIRGYALNKPWGDPEKYDIELEKNIYGNYIIKPLPKAPLSEVEQVLKANIDKDVLLQLVQPLAPERIDKLLVLL